MVKSYSQKLRVLYVMQILLQYSDEEHPVPQAEISERSQMEILLILTYRTAASTYA